MQSNSTTGFCPGVCLWLKKACFMGQNGQFTADFLDNPGFSVILMSTYSTVIRASGRKLFPVRVAFFPVRAFCFPMKVFGPVAHCLRSGAAWHSRRFCGVPGQACFARRSNRFPAALRVSGNGHGAGSDNLPNLSLARTTPFACTAGTDRVRACCFHRLGGVPMERRHCVHEDECGEQAAANGGPVRGAVRIFAQ